MHWPQIVLIVLTALDLGIKLAKHGQPRAPYHGAVAAIDAAFYSWLLWFGGFFG